MSESTAAHRSLHPLLIVAPAALIPLGFIFDALHRATDNEAYAKAAYASLAGGLIGGTVAAVAGARDYLEIESDSEVKRTANVHAMLNGGVMAVTVANLALRSRDAGPGTGSLILSALGALGIAVSGLFGARTAHEQNAHAPGAGPAGKAPDLDVAQPDSLIGKAMQRVERYAPSFGPTLY
ncbi:DUF2231 domain-containing protein [Massilia sp. 9096]|uniref:DUF2231 domain-containing protein n=1 Tax=Massilia sp. 9096 TaxID=1500894 RepID=UPI0005630A68|nr:DUF2231 domain-containing protein [Massilia sp. 9096]